MIFMKPFILYFFLLFSLQSIAQKTDSIILKNAVLYYYTYGQGEPILILSGGPGIASHQEDDLAMVLSKNHKAILFDQRGTGKSWTKPLDSTTINIKTAIADIEILRKHLGIRKLTLSGHSWGAILASAYTARYPAFVKNLLLIGGGELDNKTTAYVNENLETRFQLGDTTLLNYWQDSANAQKDPEKAKLEIRKINWSVMSYDRSKLDKIVEQASHGSFNTQMNQIMWKDLRNEHNWVSSLRKNYTGKALVIFGWQDPIALTTLASYKDAYPRAEIVGINKCGHMLSVEQPEIFFKTILDYLQKTK